MEGSIHRLQREIRLLLQRLQPLEHHRTKGTSGMYLLTEKCIMPAAMLPGHSASDCSRWILKPSNCAAKERLCIYRHSPHKHY
jgi:hypothetical protein